MRYKIIDKCKQHVTFAFLGKFHGKSVIVLTFLFFQSLALLAQDQQVRWLQATNGLPVTAIDDIEQDSKGNMLFATHLGIFEFNGEQYTNLTQQDGLANSSTGSVDVDSKGRLWVTSYSGKISLQENGKINEFKVFNASSYCGISATRIFFLSDNQIAIDLMQKGICLIYHLVGADWKLEKKVTFDPEERLPVYTANDDIWWLEYGSMNKTKQCTLRSSSLSKSFSIDPDKISFLRNFHEDVTLLTLENWLIKIHNGKVTSRRFDKAPGTVYGGKSQSIWVTFLNGGAREIDLNDLTDKGEHFLKKEQIRDLKQDLEGNLWIATRGSKLGMIPFSPYRKWNSGLSIEGKLNSVFALNDTLFLGHINGDVGILVPDRMEKEVMIFRTEKQAGIFPSNVRDFIVFNDQIYFSSQLNGLFRIDRRTLKVKQVLSGLGVSNLCVGGKYLYLATNSGLYTYDGKNTNRLTGGNINAVSLLLDGSLLIGKQDGLYDYRNKQIKKVKWPVKTGERVTCFAQQNGMVVTGFYGTGLILTDGKTYTTIRKKDGLPSDFINAMIFNSKGQLVVTTGNGAAIITLVPDSKKGYTIQSIPGNECLNYDTYYVSESKGILYFSSYNGLMEVKNIVVSKKGNPLVFGKIRVNGKIWNSSEVSLQYNEGNLIELFYKQNNFSSNEHVAYFYRLNKNDKWIQTTNESLVLKNLNPGDYTVEVYALNPYSGFRTDIIQKRIQIVPLIYQRIWFKILVLALLSGAIFLIVRMIIRKRDDKRKRELQFQLEITQLEARALRSQMNPHFIFNSLNSIQSFILKNDRDSAYKYLGKFSELIREILENSRNEKISIADEIHMLTNYLELERMRSDNSFNFDIVVDGRIHEHTTQIPIMLLQPVVENAIVHGVIPLEGRIGMISIVFCSVGENTLEIIVRDNGIGRKASQELNDRKQRYHRSMGMEISEERANKQLMNDQAYSFEIKDLHAEDGTAAGTEVIIRIKLKHD